MFCDIDIYFSFLFILLFVRRRKEWRRWMRKYVGKTAQPPLSQRKLKSTNESAGRSLRACYFFFPSFSFSKRRVCSRQRARFRVEIYPGFFSQTSRCWFTSKHGAPWLIKIPSIRRRRANDLFARLPPKSRCQSNWFSPLTSDEFLLFGLGFPSNEEKFPRFLVAVELWKLDRFAVFFFFFFFFFSRLEHSGTKEVEQVT